MSSLLQLDQLGARCYSLQEAHTSLASTTIILLYWLHNDSLGFVPFFEEKDPLLAIDIGWTDQIVQLGCGPTLGMNGHAHHFGWPYPLFFSRFGRIARSNSDLNYKLGHKKLAAFILGRSSKYDYKPST